LDQMDDFGRRIDYRSALPYYVQLKESLQQRIKLGEWKPGSRLPSEPDLCQAYGVSRTVVRQALRDLELEGVIARRKGKGTFVAEPKISENLVQKLTGFYQDMVDRGHQPVTQVLAHKVVPANQTVAYRLNLNPGTRIFLIDRLRFVDDEPILFVTTYIPHALCPKLADADLSNQSLYAFLENECGLVIAHGRRTVEAVAADEHMSKLLQVPLGAPLIQLESVSYLEDGTPLEYYIAFHRGDRSRFEVELVRIQEQGQVRKVLGEESLELPRSNNLQE
jgi:GntR family transcriptional regulator